MPLTDYNKFISETIKYSIYNIKSLGRQECRQGENSFKMINRF